MKLICLLVFSALTAFAAPEQPTQPTAPQMPNLTQEQRQLVAKLNGTKCVVTDGYTKARRLTINDGQMTFTDSNGAPLYVFAVYGKKGLRTLLGKRLMGPYGYQYVSMKVGFTGVKTEIGGGLRNGRNVFNVVNDFKMKCTHPRLARRR